MTKSNNEWQAKGVEVTCNGRMVATTFGGDLYKHCTDFDAQQAFDHARLIAAAPELYAALKAFCNQHAQHYGLDGAWDEVLIKAQSALEKAKGDDNE
jgi:hypothetical protein